MRTVTRTMVAAVLAGCVALCLDQGARAAGEAGVGVVGVGELRCESMVNPLAVGVNAPRFSWKIQEGGKGQAAYRILVASSPELLAKDMGDLWDSGRMASDETVQIAYGGRALAAGQHAWWKAMSWESADARPVSSPVARFSMGLLRPEDWKGKWIAFPNDDADKVNEAVPLFRKEFALAKPVARATVHVCGLGQYELRLNGQKVGDAFLTPAWTVYPKTSSYDTYDVTSQLQQGGNAIGISLGNGMYNVLKLPERFTKLTGTYGAPKAIVQLDIEHTDGTHTVVTTDGSWKAARGPTMTSHEYGGEDYDARRAMAGWDRVGFDAGKWVAAEETAAPGEGKSELVAAINPPSTIQKVYPAVKITQPSAGVYVYDFGQNLAGFPHLKVKGPAGAEVKLTPGETLARDGTVSQSTQGAGRRGAVWFMYTLNGSGEEEWRPQYTYYGYRYVQVEGAKPERADAIAMAGTSTQPAAAPPTATVVDLTSEFVHADVPVVGTFESSDETLNKIHALITGAMLSNTQSVLTDCPHREKLGWLEQSHLMADALFMNFDYSTLYAKMCMDMRDAQTAEGLVPNIAPEFTVFKGGFRDSPEWGAAAVIDPWMTYLYYGDIRTLEKQYSTMQRYVAYLGTTAKDHIVDHGLGDWYDIGPKAPGVSQLTTIAFTSTAVYYQDLEVMRRAAVVLGKGEDAKAYGLLAAEVKNAFNAKFYDAASGQYEKGSQTAYAMPLVLGLVEEAKREAVLGKLVESVTRMNGRVTAGDVGFSYVVKALTEAGRGDVMYEMMTQDQGPGYVMQLRKGATTLTEGWDGSHSQNHLMLGHAEAWLFRGLAGIQNAPGSIAFQRFIVRPQIVEKLAAKDGRKYVNVSYDSVRGKIVSNWELNGKALTMNVTVPSTTTATIYVPAADPAAVSAPANVKVGASQEGAAVFEAPSGTYTFKSTLP